MHVDDNCVSFEDIGGHSQDIKALKEIVFIPLLFPQLYATFGIKPQRGVLLCGHPSTGKTLMVRAELLQEVWSESQLLHEEGC